MKCEWLPDEIFIIYIISFLQLANCRKDDDCTVNTFHQMTDV